MGEKKKPSQSFKVFNDVLMDIDESPLNEEEQSEERETVNNARKEALGENFQHYLGTLELLIIMLVFNI